MFYNLTCSSNLAIRYRIFIEKINMFEISIRWESCSPPRNSSISLHPTAERASIKPLSNQILATNRRPSFTAADSDGDRCPIWSCYHPHSRFTPPSPISCLSPLITASTPTSIEKCNRKQHILDKVVYVHVVNQYAPSLVQNIVQHAITDYCMVAILVQNAST